MRHATAPRTHHVRNTVVLTLAAVLAFTVAGATTVYARLQHNVTVADALTLAGPVPPDPPGHPGLVADLDAADRPRGGQADQPAADRLGPA